MIPDSFHLPDPRRQDRTPVRKGLRLGVSLLALGVLAACGGSGDEAGGGGAGRDYVLVPSPTPAPGGSGILGSFYVASFAPYETVAENLRQSAIYAVQQFTWNLDGQVFNSFALASSRTEYAHAVGLTGQGQTVSVVDAGFRATHETIVDNVVDVGNGVGLDDHGTSVASIIAGFSDRMVGVAPNADLALGSFDTTATLTAATNKALELGAVAQNNSWGLVDTKGTATQLDDTTLFATQANFNNTFAPGDSYLAALDAYAAQGVVVFAVSNETSDGQSGLLEALPALRPSLEDGWLAVGNAVPVFDADRVLSATLNSAACLQAAAWCLVADGSWRAATSASNTSYTPDGQIEIGSSFAAPQVSGALALLAEAFPNLDPHQLRLRLLASADNSFFTHTGQLTIEGGLNHGYNDEFGHGFLDLRSALLPIGTPRVTLASGRSARLDSPLVVAGSAMGDALSRSLSAVDVTVSDALDAGFSVPGEALVAASGVTSVGSRALSRALSDGLAAQRLASLGRLDTGFDAFRGQRLNAASADGAVRATVLMPASGQADGDYGISLATAFGDGGTSLDLGVKLARDHGAVFGLGGSGGSSASDLFAVQVGLSQDLGGDGFLRVTGEIGMASLGTSDLVTDASTTRFDSLGLEVGQRNFLTRGDRIAFGASMPMAVTSGRAQAVLPVAMGRGVRELQSVALDLQPGQRQTDLSLTYNRPLGDGIEMMLELLHSENLGNLADTRDTAAVMALTWAF